MRVIKWITQLCALRFMGPQMSYQTNSKGFDALEALMKGFMVALPSSHDLHLGDLTLMNQSKRPFLANLFCLQPTWPSLACHLIDLELESKYETKVEDIL